MNNTNTGGPAFPVSALVYNDDGGDPTTIIHDGMTLRDYFAAMACEEDIAKHSLKGFIEEYILDLGNGRKELRNREARRTREEAKYRYADAMLKAREE